VRAAQTSLAESVLRYGIPLVLKANGWDGVIIVDWKRPLRGSGTGAVGYVFTPAKRLDARWVDLSEPEPGLFEIAIGCDGNLVITGLVRVAVGIVPGELSPASTEGSDAQPK
jgi:hypothetical protein